MLPMNRRHGLNADSPVVKLKDVLDFCHLREIGNSIILLCMPTVLGVLRLISSQVRGAHSYVYAHHSAHQSIFGRGVVGGRGGQVVGEW